MMSSPDVILSAPFDSAVTVNTVMQNAVIQTNISEFNASSSSAIALLETDLQSMEFNYQSASYNWGLSTEANYQSSNDYDLGIFASTRRHLDYGYHSHYQAPRRRLQDDIIESFLQDHPVVAFENQWIIFTAGCMGAGKTHTLRELTKQDPFSLNLQSFVTVDPDEIRSQLPEFELYKKKDPLHAGEYTGKEAGMLAEILTEEALNRGNSVLVDGSLKNAEWHKAYFESLRKKYPKLKLGMIHVTAPLEDILLRVEQRARTTGRRIPMDVLMESMIQVPRSVRELSQYADFFLEVDNSSGRGITFPIVQGVDTLVEAPFSGQNIVVQ